MKPTHHFYKIKILQRKSNYSAWFHADPINGINSSLATLVDCERIDALGRSYSCTDTEKQFLKHGGWYAGRWGVYG